MPIQLSIHSYASNKLYANFYSTENYQTPRIYPSIYLLVPFRSPFSTLAGTPFLVPPLNANRLPIFPKQTQLQNNTLRIQTAPSMLSLPTHSPAQGALFPRYGYLEVALEAEAGLGIMSGFETSSSAVPVAPTAVERMKPGFERSTRYQRTGLTSARVREAWRVEVQGSFLCIIC
jgi:hypothetical protein